MGFGIFGLGILTKVSLAPDGANFASLSLPARSFSRTRYHGGHFTSNTTIGAEKDPGT